MENLSKQDFDEIFAESPKTYKVFLVWVDIWKLENNYAKLFNPKYFEDPERLRMYSTPKFHDLPFDLQKGVLLRFLCETYPNSRAVRVNSTTLKITLINCAKVIEKTLK